MKIRQKAGATVLLVDDQEILRLLMCKTLENGGFRVLEANNGADALNLFRSAEPPVDLLVTDYRMPGMTGLALARECCSLNEELSVLYISGSGPGDDLQADLAAARRRFLAKPFRQSDLLHSAKAILAMEPVASAESRVSACVSSIERWSMSLLTGFFKESDTQLGVFYPKHYLIAVFRDSRASEQAVEDLWQVGFPKDEAIAVAGQEFVDLAKEETGPGNFVMQALSRFFATEQKTHDSDLDRAKHGAGFIAVHCPTDELKQTAWSRLQPESPVAARYYGSAGIEHLAGDFTTN